MPLVDDILRQRHGDLIRMSDDPKTVVALGAARLAWSLGKNDPSAPILEEVLEVRSTTTWLYALCADENGHHVLRRLDPTIGEADREVQFGRVVDWGVSDDGMVVVETNPGGLLLHTLTPEMTIRSGQRFSGKRGARVLVRGATGWVFFTDDRARKVNHVSGLPWGEVGKLTVVELDLRAFFVQDVPETSLGEQAQWFVNEDNRQRRLFDQDGPTGNEPASAVGADGCVVVLGRFTGRRSLTGVYRTFTPSQALCVLAPGGKITTIDRSKPNWLQQVLLYDGKWFISTNVGLEIDAAPDPVRVVAPRPRGGALRWVPAGGRMYAVGMDTVVPSRGWAVMLYEADGRVRLLHHEQRTSLLGHLTSRDKAERPRLLVDGDTLWIAVSGPDGTSRIMHVTPAGVSEFHRAPGWIEPVAKVPHGLLCLHRPDAEPGDGQAEPADLVRLVV
ncbi:hypothetical protein AB0K60_10600 [Thermopolyspora sp. NPDC052614]|uniref:hypothetical protein n=1 Tax=Thermopolyspora sp. NPDC052614 TaxID=3155682 RepID=UPI0034443690